jgi:hypothetical protein
MLKLVESWRPSWISDRQTIHNFSTGPPNDHSCKVTIQLAWWFLTRRFLKFQPIRTHYKPWQPCWISNQHQKHKSGRGPSNEHFWQIWLKSVQRFQRRRFKCEKVTDGRRTLTHDKSSHGLWPGELKTNPGLLFLFKVRSCVFISNFHHSPPPPPKGYKIVSLIINY